MSYKQFYKIIEQNIDALFLNKKNEPIELYEPQKYILSLGGKRLRPMLCLIGNDLFNGNINHAIPASMCVELFHNFSLVHDDILDKAPLRRNKKTIHKKWNTNIAILSGDALMVKAYLELNKSENEHLKLLVQLFSNTAIEVCEGQQEDMNFESKNKVLVDQYEKMIAKKTAVLLACSLKMGAITANANELDAEHLYQFGKNIGIAFQLKDDILDVYSEKELFGKQEAGDIISNKKTFLLLKTLELANPKQLQDLYFWLAQKKFDPIEKIKSIKKIYGKLKIQSIADKEAKKYFEKARFHLEKIKVAKKKKEILLAFAEQLMNRMF